MINNKEYVNKILCPYCNTLANTIMSEDEENNKPSIGDLVMCTSCGEISEFDKDMKIAYCNLSKLNKEDLIKIRYYQYKLSFYRLYN